MTSEYENYLNGILGDEMELESTGEGYDVHHPDLDESFRLVTEKKNITAAAAYILENELDVDTDYGFAQLLGPVEELKEKGFVDEGGDVAINIPDSLAELCNEEENIYEQSHDYCENFDERATEVARVIDGLGKSIVSSKQISEHLDLTPSQVAETMNGIAVEEGVEGELGERTGSVISWNVHILEYDTNVVVDLD